MKKLFGLVLAILLMLSMFSVTALAGGDKPNDETEAPEFEIEDENDAAFVPTPPPAEGVVMSISALKKDEEAPVFIENCTDLVQGWNKAIDLAKSKETMEANGYDRIVVDLYSDWTAKDSEFCNDGVGFSYDAIYFPEGVKVMLNMNGYTIDRAMTTWQYNGEVMCLEKKADVIINGGKAGDPIVRPGNNPDGVQMGTITGGWSCNGAGGIHVEDRASLVLNNVRVDNNVADDDDGGGIALYNGAKLVMKGGSLNHNVIDFATWLDSYAYGGAIYVEESDATLENVAIKNNQSKSGNNKGVAIYAFKSNVSIKDCVVEANGLENKKNDIYTATSIIHSENSQLTVTGTRFNNNGAPMMNDTLISSVISADVDSSTITLNTCYFENNHSAFLIDTNSNYVDFSTVSVERSTFINNQSAVMQGSFYAATFSQCTFNNNKTTFEKVCAFMLEEDDTLVLRECSMGDSDYNRKSNVEFLNAQGKPTGGSIFGDGSVTVVVALTALVASLASIGVTIASNKQKAATHKNK